MIRKLRDIHAIARALREEGFRDRAWKSAIWMEIIQPYFPHRVYTFEGDEESLGTRLEWKWRKRTLYRAKEVKPLLEGDD